MVWNHCFWNYPMVSTTEKLGRITSISSALLTRPVPVGLNTPATYKDHHRYYSLGVYGSGHSGYSRGPQLPPYPLGLVPSFSQQTCNEYPLCPWYHGGWPRETFAVQCDNPIYVGAVRSKKMNNYAGEWRWWVLGNGVLTSVQDLIQGRNSVKEVKYGLEYQGTFPGSLFMRAHDNWYSSMICEHRHYHCHQCRQKCPRSLTAPKQLTQVLILYKEKLGSWTCQTF